MDSAKKIELAKQKVDAMTNLPGVMLRKTVVRIGDPLMGFTDYNIKLLRDEDRRFVFYAEWVDPDGEGHRIVLPHGVVESIIRLHDSLMNQARKDRAVKAANTRKTKGIPEVFYKPERAEE